MKKIISFILVLCLLLSVCGCKREDPEDTAAPLDITEGAPEKEELPEDKTEQEQTKTEDKTEQEQTENENETESENSEPEIIETQTEDKGEYFPYTIDDYFRPLEVIVTFTIKETEKNKKYTVEDFPELDLSLVFEMFEYEYEYSPGGKERKTVFLLLKEPSKQTVLDYIEILKQDERVYCATPNLHQMMTREFFVVLNDQTEKPIDDYSKEDFPELDLIFLEPDSLYDNVLELDLRVEDTTKEEQEQKMLEAIYKVQNNDAVAFARPKYFMLDTTCVYVKIKEEEYAKKQTYTVDDFKEVEATATWNLENREVAIYLDNYGQYEISNAINKLMQNDLVQSANVATCCYVEID